MEHRELINGCTMISHVLPNSRRHGLVSISKNGQLLYSCNYICGIPDGILFNNFTTKPQNGTYFNVNGLSIYYEGNNTKGVARYKNGLLHGTVRKYKAAKQKTFKVDYVNGVKHGRYYSSKFNTATMGEYVCGKKHGKFYHFCIENRATVTTYDHGVVVDIHFIAGRYVLNYLIEDGLYKRVARLWEINEPIHHDKIVDIERVKLSYLSACENDSDYCEVIDSESLINNLRNIQGRDDIVKNYMSSPISPNAIFFGSNTRHGYAYKWLANGTRIKYHNGGVVKKSITYPNGDIRTHTPSLIEKRRFDGSIISRWVIVNNEPSGIKSIWNINGELISKYYCINGHARALMR
jgi:antitoxin component YwqK of YwqJK toxin-antitoxin module